MICNLLQRYKKILAFKDFNEFFYDNTIKFILKR